jgi:D-arabinose 1-dehydrogenase-like Zn-dependent alcohol dehydrogenase
MALHELGGSLKLEDVPIPEVGPGEALARVDACGVGYTVSKSRKTRGIVPRIPGHEVAGEIVAVGEGVKHITVGDLVTVLLSQLWNLSVLYGRQGDPLH